ncbi:MAG: DUF1320 family protein [Verrucomicrobiae bacterium]|nr:DUF1320 family protein [Verrucomicrobiae bacterium]
MPTPTFSQDDLMLPPQQMARLHTALVNLGQQDPLGRAVAEATDTVGLYLRGFSIPDSQWRRMMRPVVIWMLYTQVSMVSDAVQKAYDAIMGELRDIRDGKFSLPIEEEDPDDPVPVTGGAWGSEEKIKTR